MTKVKSINNHRLSREPLEKKFVDAWNKRVKETLPYILDRSHSNRGDYYPSKLEQEVAVTIIQWLGSPVGQAFIEEVHQS